MCQINIVGDVPFPVGNYTNIDQSAIKKPELVKTIIYSECNTKSKILLWQNPIQYSILHAVRFHKTVTMFFLKTNVIVAQGASQLADELSKVVSKAQSLYLKQRLENAVQKKITDFFNS